MVHEFKPNCTISLPFPPNSPNPSLSSKSNYEEEEKWRHLMENHHELCDLDKCLGKRINGLFVCQFSNIPGNIYSQYLRHRRRQGAFKTKPCRNFFGPNRYCPAGDQCSFYHGLEDKREVPQQPLLPSNAIDEGNNGVGIGAAGEGNGVDLVSQMFGLNINNMGTTMFNNGNRHRLGSATAGQGQQQRQQVTNALDNLIIQVVETCQRMSKQAASTDDCLRTMNQTHHVQQQWHFNSLQPTKAAGGPITPVFQCLAIGQQPKKKSSSAERWYSAGGVIGQGHPVTEFGNAPSNVTSWEECSAITDNSSRSMSPPLPATRRFNFLPSLAVGGDASGSVGNAPFQQQQSQEPQQQKGVLGFAKSFHPFGESYPLKNLSANNTNRAASATMQHASPSNSN